MLAARLGELIADTEWLFETLREIVEREDRIDRRDLVRSCYGSGAYTVTLTGFETKPSGVDDTVNMVELYLFAKLGYPDEVTRDACETARHVKPQPVLAGVALHDAVIVKEELESLGARIRLTEKVTDDDARGYKRAPIPERVRHEVWRRDQGCCVVCGSQERLEFDHIIPISRGGSNTARNIELRCEHHNRSKGAQI